MIVLDGPGVASSVVVQSTLLNFTFVSVGSSQVFLFICKFNHAVMHVCKPTLQSSDPCLDHSGRMLLLGRDIS